MPHGVEYYHSPSTRAQNLWLYVVSIGRAKANAGHSHGHEHEARFLIHYIRRGQFWHRLHDQTYLARPGTVCFMDLRQPVRYGNDGPGAVEVWWVCLGGKDLPELFAELCADRRPLFEGIDTRAFEQQFQTLLQSTRRKPAGYEAKASGLLMLIIGELLAVREATLEVDIDLVSMPRRVGTLSPPVRDSIRYMARFFDSLLDLKKLSGVAGLSMYHFVRVFRRETGLSPMQYLSHYRIEKAKRVLANSDEPLALVARMAGIPNQFKFSRLFHKLTGMTPSQYRARKARTSRS